MQDIKVKNTTWAKDHTDLKSLRQNIFVLEQGVDQDLEWDGKDEAAEHYLAYIEGKVVGCARLLEDKKNVLSEINLLRDNNLDSDYITEISYDLLGLIQPDQIVIDIKK